jgi:DNA-binding MarR family transcriptional regulator
MNDALARMDLTAAQGRIMGYLAHQKQPPCARDIEEAFQLSHPTVSGLLGRLEKKGFIQFLPDPADRRCKRIHILPHGQACLDTMHQTISDVETRLVQGFTEEEQQQFAQLLHRAIKNMSCGSCNSDPKEETPT